MARWKAKKSKHLQRKNFGTAGKQIEKTFLTCIVALNNGKKKMGINRGFHCQWRRKVLISFDRMMLVHYLINK